MNKIKHNFKFLILIPHAKTPNMKENKYDNDKFSEQYSRMPCSTEGLKGAGEWHAGRTAASDDADPVFR